MAGTPAPTPFSNATLALQATAQQMAGAAAQADATVADEQQQIKALQALLAQDQPAAQQSNGQALSAFQAFMASAAEDLGLAGTITISVPPASAAAAPPAAPPS